MIFVLACAIGVAAWVALLWNMFRVPFNLKPGVRAWALGNPFNYLFRPDALTATGLQARRRSGLSLLVFVVAVITGAMTGLLAKWLA